MNKDSLNSDIFISVVVPMHNEESNIDALFSSLTEVLERLAKQYEIVCVNDGSTDDTLERLLKARADNDKIKIIDL